MSAAAWLTGQLAALRACPDLHLTVLCVGKEDADGTADGVHYRVVRDTAAFAPLLQAERPDLVHIWGTEFDPAAVMADAARASRLARAVQRTGRYAGLRRAPLRRRARKIPPFRCSVARH